MNTRPYEASDYDRAAVLLGDARAVNDKRNRLHVVEGEGGALAGVGLWHRPDAGDPCALSIALLPGQPPSVFYELLAACIEDAIAEGYERGSARVLDPRIVRTLERDTGYTAASVGTDTRTGEPAEWRFEVELSEALERVQALVRALTLSTGSA